MADYRSKSYSDGKMHIEPYQAPSSATGPTNLRSYSTSYVPTLQQKQVAPPQKLKKGRSSSSKSWSTNDPEFQRKKRIASYKVYTIDGKLKGSVRKSVKWLKDSYTQMFYGWS